MHLEKSFEVDQQPERIFADVAQEETLLGLFPDTENEIIAKRGNHRTVRSHYRALGQEGTATFHFTLEPETGLRFEKVCDGRIWSELSGRMSFRAHRGGTRVRIEMDGRTKPFVPEFTVRGAMRDQLEQMTRALRRRFEND